MTGVGSTADRLALTVHGPAGVLDLVVPAGASAVDVAREYAREAGLPAIPVLYTPLGAALPPDTDLAHAGVEAGDVLVAAAAVPPRASRARLTDPRGCLPGRRLPPARAGFAVIAGLALLAGWSAARTSGVPRTVALDLLAGAAVLAIVPVGRNAVERAAAAPAFAFAATFAAVFDPHPERTPIAVGVSALAAAVVAAVARALDRRAGETLLVWMVAGVAVFLVTGLCTLTGAPPRLPWALLLLGAVLAARFVPGLAVDVPDTYLLDLDRLAVTAWSARERTGGRRGRSVVDPATVAAVAGRGARTVTASAVAVLAVTAVAAPMLLAAAALPIDRIGARCLVGLAGAGLLLAARSYRHAGARTLLRVAGLACGVALLVVLAPTLGRSGSWAISIGAVLVAAAVVVAAVATGRGWRSAWWSRRAELAEAACGALAVASLVVAAGWFRTLWELASLWELNS